MNKVFINKKKIHSRVYVGNKCKSSENKTELFQLNFSGYTKINKFVYGRIFLKDNILLISELKKKCILKKIYE